VGGVVKSKSGGGWGGGGGSILRLALWFQTGMQED